MASLSNNSILFIGLANEYCNLIESCNETEKNVLIDNLLKLLPRLYISMSDFTSSSEEPADAIIDSYLDEIYYDSIRLRLENVIGEDDTILEVFEEDMKFSDTPIAVSISEYLADIFQYLYDFIHAAKDATDNQMDACLQFCKENFVMYWGQTLCNVLRALHHIKYEYR